MHIALSRFLSLVAALAVFLFAAVAFGQTPLPSPDDPSALIAALFAAATGKQWLLLAALACIGTVYVMRKLVGPRVKWFATKAGGFVLNYVTSLLLAVAPYLMSGKAWSWSVLVGMLSIALTAAGGYEALREVVVPAVKWLWSKVFGSKAAPSV